MGKPLPGHAKKGALDHPEDISRRQDDSQHRQGGGDRVGPERSQEHQQFRNESAETGQTQGGQAGDEKGDGNHRHPPGQTTQVRDEPGMGLVVDQPHGDEQKAGDGAVGEKLQRRAVQAG